LYRSSGGDPFVVPRSLAPSTPLEVYSKSRSITWYFLYFGFWSSTFSSSRPHAMRSTSRPATNGFRQVAPSPMVINCSCKAGVEGRDILLRRLSLVLLRSPTAAAGGRKLFRRRQRSMPPELRPACLPDAFTGSARKPICFLGPGSLPAGLVPRSTGAPAPDGPRVPRRIRHRRPSETRDLSAEPPVKRQPDGRRLSRVLPPPSRRSSLESRRRRPQLACRSSRSRRPCPSRWSIWRSPSRKKGVSWCLLMMPNLR